MVDTDETATRLVELMNKEKAGRVTFIPLNRVRTRTYQYPTAANANSRDALPMMEQIQVEERFQKAFEHVSRT